MHSMHLMRFVALCRIGIRGFSVASSISLDGFFDDDPAAPIYYRGSSTYSIAIVVPPFSALSSTAPSIHPSDGRRPRRRRRRFFASLDRRLWRDDAVVFIDGCTTSLATTLMTSLAATFASSLRDLAPHGEAAVFSTAPGVRSSFDAFGGAAAPPGFIASSARGAGVRDVRRCIGRRISSSRPGSRPSATWLRPWSRT